MENDREARATFLRELRELYGPGGPEKWWSEVKRHSLHEWIEEIDLKMEDENGKIS